MPRLDKLYVLDWEMAMAGLPEMDIGSFRGEMRLLQRFHPSRQEEASTITRSFLSGYKQGSGPDEALARVTITHVGAYLVARTPQEPLGDREKIRETVAEGVGLLIGSAEGTREWLEGSQVRHLLR
jgi:hypothetical protein